MQVVVALLTKGRQQRSEALFVFLGSGINKMGSGGAYGRTGGVGKARSMSNANCCVPNCIGHSAQSPFTLKLKIEAQAHIGECININK